MCGGGGGGVATAVVMAFTLCRAEFLVHARPMRPARHVQVVKGYENGNFLGPTILDDVKPGNPGYDEEIFGPVVRGAPLLPYPAFPANLCPVTSHAHAHIARTLTRMQQNT